MDPELTSGLMEATKGWGGRRSSQYTRVKVLLAGWESDDLGVDEELEALSEVYSDYKYEVERYAIPDNQPSMGMVQKVIEFMGKAQRDALLIFWYAGHGFTDPITKQTFWTRESASNCFLTSS